VIILGFDGVEPEILREMMERGDAPNYAKLAQGGTFKKLGSTIPPQSPVAWTSFTTCKNPGGHNIYDFILRDPSPARGPMPKVGTGELEHVKLTGDGAVSEPAKGVAYRNGDSFWYVADQQGLKCKILKVPFAYPADPMKNGIQLCGLGVPDLRGTTSISFDISEAFTPDQHMTSMSGGMRVRPEFDGAGVATLRLPGPRNQSVDYGKPGDYTPSEITLKVDRKMGVGSAEADGKKIEFTTGTWSEWLPLPFKMSDKYTTFGITRVYPLEIGDQVRLYMSCMMIHPGDPYASITQPVSYSKELTDRFGLFRTIGWQYDTHALRQDRLNEDAFLDDVRQGMAWNEQLTLDELDRGDFDLLVSVWEATDRVGHMFWRFRDKQHPMYDPELAVKFEKALEESYQISDRIVGEVMQRLKPGDLFMVLSDHGFESWRRGFDANAWLEEQGYLTVGNRAQAQRGFLLGIDWTKTKAYAVGLSSMYLNLSGRERVGIVPPMDADNVINEIKAKLLTVKDTEKGTQTFSSIYTKHNFAGVAIGNAPDISFGFDGLHQVSKSVAAGGVGDVHFEDNMDKWGGEHASSDVARLPGIFFCNQAVEADDPNILDLGVTALGYLGADVPSDFEGKDLFA
jgi:predicted AlkP superfamily phosphohydrolase/phosphomutase